MKKAAMYEWIIFAISILLLHCSPPGKETLSHPNILFAIADDASYPHMSAYGCAWVKTPAFDRVSREGLLFNNAYTPNAKCAPSRACILTGRNSWQLEEAANHVPFFPVKFNTYAEVLKQNGYHVGYTAKGWAPGVANNADGSPRELTGKAYNSYTTTPPTKNRPILKTSSNKSPQESHFVSGTAPPNRTGLMSTALVLKRGENPWMRLIRFRIFGLIMIP